MASPRALKGAIILSALYFLSRVVGLVQSAVINAYLPTNATDAYWAAFAIPDFINYLIAGGALSITFIPIFTELHKTNREREAWRFFSSIAALMSLVLIVLLIIAEIFSYRLVAIARSGLLERPDVFNLTVAMTRVLLPAQWFFYIGGLLVGVLNAYKRFAATGWTGAVYNAAAIVVALFLWWMGAGPIAFAWGILIGAFLGNFLLPLLAARAAPRNQRPQFSFAIDLSSPHVRKYFLNAIPIMLGVSLPVMDQNIVTWFATYMGNGVVTHLTLGNRVMIAAQVVVGQAASVAAFPYLAELVAQENWQDFSKFLRDGLRRLLFLTLPLSVLLILLARPIIIVLFGYGKFDNAHALNETALAFAFFSVGLFAWTAQQLLARGFYAMQDTLTPTIIGTVLTVAFILLMLVARNYGVLGLAAGTSLGAGVQFIAISIALDKRLSRRTYNAPLRLDKIAGLTLRTICACAVMGIVSQFGSTLLQGFLPEGKLGALVQIVVIGTFASVIFAGCARAFAIPEWTWLVSKFGSRLRRG